MKKLILIVLMGNLFISCSKKQVIGPAGPAVIEYRITSTDTTTYLITYSDSTSKLVTDRFSGDVWSATVTKRSPNLTISDFFVENIDPWIPPFSSQISILIDGQYAANQMVNFNFQNTNCFLYSRVH